MIYESTQLNQPKNLRQPLTFQTLADLENENKCFEVASRAKVVSQNGQTFVWSFVMRRREKQQVKARSDD